MRNVLAATRETVNNHRHAVGYVWESETTIVQTAFMTHFGGNEIRYCLRQILVFHGFVWQATSDERGSGNKTRSNFQEHCGIGYPRDRFPGDSIDRK